MIEIKNCDCLIGMKEIPAQSVDMILTDLPYETTNCNWDKKIPFEPLWGEFLRVTKLNAAIVLFSQMPFGAELIMSNRKMFRYEFVWEKPAGAGFLNAKRMPLRCHEDILVFYRKLPTYNPQFTCGKAYVSHSSWVGEGVYNPKTPRIDSENDGQHYYPRDVLKFANVSNKERFHSTQKPVKLLEYLIRTYTNAGELVLDATMGSGSTGVACLNSNRRFIGFEKDAQIYDAAASRLQAAQKICLQPALF